MTAATLVCAAAGGILLSRILCLVSRVLGAVLVAAAVLLAAAPAFADETLLSSDNSQVDCSVSARDLTRISLVEDGFASVQKIAPGNPGEDFTIVNEPLRGDVYLSVPDGFPRDKLSFFATSKRGYVYKFVCKIINGDAAQIFVSNPAITRAPDAASVRRPASLQDAAVALIQAMYQGGVADGYTLRQQAMTPVQLGGLKVQLIAEYRGSDLTGRVLRLENKGAAVTSLDETAIAPRSAIAVSVAQPRLAPGQVTTAYVVTKGAL